MVLDSLKTSAGMNNITAFIKGKGKIKNNPSFLQIDENIMCMQGVLLELENEELRDEISYLVNKGLPHVCTFNSISEKRVNFNIKVFSSIIPNFFPEKILTILVDEETKNEVIKNDYLSDIVFSITDIDKKESLYTVLQCTIDEEERINNFAFSIIGEKYIFDVEGLKVEGGECFSLKKIRRRRNDTSYSNYVLIEGFVQFKNNIEFINEYQKACLEKIQKEKASTFLTPWKDYWKERGNVLVSNIKKVGAIHFNVSENVRLEKSEEGKILQRLNFTETISDEVKELLKNENVDIYYPSKDMPLFLGDDVITFNDYQMALDVTNEMYKSKSKNIDIFDDEKVFEELYKKLDEECSLSDGDEKTEKELDKKQEETFNDKDKKSTNKEGFVDTFLVSKVTNSYIDIEKSKSIPSKGFLCFSGKGEGVQLVRQQNAIKMLETGNSGIPYLASLLEREGEIPVKVSKAKNINLTPYVQEKCFKYPPTPNQLRAINIALETPDIAIIQGPPGSGKTTVINAIVEMLNVKTAKTKNIAGKVLASSYQQDAVYNMIKDDKLTINSLVTAKQGNKRGGEEYLTHIERWVDEIKKRMRNTELDLSENSEISFLSYSLETYLHQMNKENEDALFDKLLKLSVFSEKEIEEIEKLKKETEFARRGIDKSFDESLLRKIRALRTTSSSFSDDGMERIIDAYDSLLPYINDRQKEVLETLGSEGIKDKTEEESEKLFNEVEDMKKALIRKFSYKPSYIQNKENKELVDKARLGLKKLEENQGDADRRTALLKSWYSILENSPSLLLNSIKDYDFVYAATCQQCVSEDVSKRLKKVSGNKYYDTVIVDEAARATPLDLLIPLVLAKGRIILVGDHRQLPQFIDDKICDKIENEFNGSLKNTPSVSENVLTEKEDIYSSSLHLSLFQLLYEICKEREKKDGIKRCITLDTQFRTHPVLGDFCSKSFYEQYGEGYKSLHDEKVYASFGHNLKGIENKAAIWIDVPYSYPSGEKKINNSYRREAEAKVIMDKLLEFCLSDESIQKEYEYGIITFYKAQEELLKKMFKNLSFVKKDGTKLSEKESEKIKKRIRIGTVDSFQGMEFDFVFLSVVRSNKYLEKRKGCNPYGHLCSVNRQCVSMSRQKKALIVVGDKDFCTTKDARKEGRIKAIADFYDLCATSKWGKVIEC